MGAFRLLCLAFFIALTSQAGPQDLSARYTELMTSAEIPWTERESQELRRYKLIFVPGFLSNVILGLGSHKLARQAQLGAYFDEQLGWLSALGVQAERIEYDYEREPGANAPFVINAIRRSKLPVILVAHSKGGLDSIQALMTMDQELRSKVKGFLAIQVPFYGSPIADCFTEIKAKRAFAKWTLPQINVSYSALETLREREAKKPSPELLEETRFLENFSRWTPVLSFASYKSREIDYQNIWQLVTGQDTLMFYSRNIMERKYSLKNDGLVPVSSAILPGSEYVVTGGVDHAVPVMYCQILKFDRIRFLKTMLRLLLNPGR